MDSFFQFFQLQNRWKYLGFVKYLTEGRVEADTVLSGLVTTSYWAPSMAGQVGPGRPASRAWTGGYGYTAHGSDTINQITSIFTQIFIWIVFCLLQNPQTFMDKRENGKGYYQLSQAVQISL